MKAVTFFFIIIFSISAYAQDDVKPCKLKMNDFKKLSIDDTSSAVIDLFFKKRDQAVFNNMTLLPLSIALIIPPQTRFYGYVSAIVTVPLFLNGTYMLTKYRKKRLHKILVEYNETKELPVWVRKKTNKILNTYDELPINY